MAKRDGIGHNPSMRTEEQYDEADQQLGHPGRLEALIAPSTKRKSLYDQQYGVFGREWPCCATPAARRNPQSLLPRGGVNLGRVMEHDGIKSFDLVGTFLPKLKPGTRNFCLIHPRRWGYNVDPKQTPMLAEEPWYQEACARFQSQAKPIQDQVVSAPTDTKTV